MPLTKTIFLEIRREPIWCLILSGIQTRVTNHWLALLIIPNNQMIFRYSLLNGNKWVFE